MKPKVQFLFCHGSEPPPFCLSFLFKCMCFLRKIARAVFVRKSVFLVYHFHKPLGTGSLYISVTLHYSVMLKSDYKDIILEHCNIEDLPASAPAYEISQKDQIQQSAIELIKLYGGSGGGFAELGDVGLPLPSGSYYISSGFGWRTLYGEANFHSGIDLAAPLGTEVYAVKDGVCSVKPFHSSYGNYVTIDHGNGVQTRYAHMSAVLVADGESVVAGQVIGLVGSTGNSTGNHLHLEVIVNGSRIDALSTDLGEPILNGSK